MRVRALDANGDMQFGRGQNDFYVNVPAGVAQCAVTRLRMNLGEWFLDQTDGTDWRGQVLGKYTTSTRDPLVRSRVYGTPGLSSVNSLASQFDPAKRTYAVQISATSVYGPINNLIVTLMQPPKVLTDQSGNVLVDESGNELIG